MYVYKYLFSGLYIILIHTTNPVSSNRKHVGNFIDNEQLNWIDMAIIFQMSVLRVRQKSLEKSNAFCSNLGMLQLTQPNKCLFKVFCISL